MQLGQGERSGVCPGRVFLQGVSGGRTVGLAGQPCYWLGSSPRVLAGQSRSVRLSLVARVLRSWG